MARIVVLGGGGGIGGVAVRTLAALGDFDEIVVADGRGNAATAVAAELGDARLSVAVFDAASATEVRRVVEGARVVVNCVGPFYRYGPPVLDAVIGAGIDYVDVCDDLDPTLLMLERDEAARAAGVTAIIGMGNSPGLANLFARLCADDLLDTVDAVDIMHAHGGEPDEGPAVVKHRIHAMTNDVPLFVDGEFVRVRMLEASGQAYVRETDFRDVGRLPVYPYPHPETITIPRHLPGVQRVTNLGIVFPLSYFSLTMDTVRAGLPDEAAVDAAVERILRERPRLLSAAGVTGPAGCLKVVVSGRKDGEPHTYVASVSSTTQGAGEGTGIPVALAATLVARDGLHAPGVSPPEAVVPVAELLALAAEVVPRLGMGSGVPIHLEHLLPDGTSETLDLGLG